MGTFQKAARKAVPAELRQPGEVYQPAKAKSIKVRKVSRKIRHGRHTQPRENHPAVLELQDTVAKYKDHIIASQRTALSSTYFELASRLAEEEQRVVQDNETREAIQRAILAPFGDELLEFRTSSQQGDEDRNKGSQLSMVKLSDRVSLFEKRASQSVATLNQVWASWQDCQAEAETAAKEFAATLDAEAELLKAVEGCGQQLKADVSNKYEEHLAACNKGEEDFSLKREQAKKSFARMAESIL